MKTTATTVKGRTTRAQEAALKALGFASETRGGDPKFSTNGKSDGGRLYTRVRTYIWRLDGAAITAADKRTIAAAL